ncbi:MAG: DUF2207 domain-containing protein [Acidimicrobiales bacterium]|nr:DUF2207 domain-containing protein [Acidimicrobiales bacterium]
MKRIVTSLALALGAAAALAGCGLADGQVAFSSSPRGSHLEALDYRVRLLPGGDLRVRMAARFLDDAGGVLAVPKPITGGVEGLAVDGRPAQGASTTEAVEVPVTGREAVATFTVTGAVAAGDDITVIDTPLVASPSDASRQDPPVEVSGVLLVPEGTAADDIEFHWVNGLDQDVRVRAGRVRFAGESPIWTTSDLLVGLPPGAAPQLEGGFAALTSVAAFQGRAQVAEADTAALESTLDDQDLQARLVSWLLVGVGAGVCLLMAVQWWRLQSSDRRARERYQATFPEHLVDPPDDLDPATVGLLVADARRLDQDAVAGTVLDLAHRGIVTIDGYGPDRWVLRVPAGARAARPAEQVVLDALRAQAPGGEISGPPLWAEHDPAWWRAYRAAVFERARDEGLVRRRFRILYVGPFAAGVVCATWPLWATQSTLWLVPVLSVALGLVFALPLGGGFEPTLEGVRSAGRWEAFGRYTRDQGHWDDVGPAGVSVWGPYLVYGTVLRTCPYATAQLAPRGGRERAGRGDAQDQVDAESLDAPA